MDASAHVKRGDRVTVLRYKRRGFRAARYSVAHMRIVATGLPNPFTGRADTYLAIHRAKPITDRTTQKILYPRDEGVTWIRGHHSEDSDEVKALLAAHALCAGQPSNR